MSSVNRTAASMRIWVCPEQPLRIDTAKHLLTLTKVTTRLSYPHPVPPLITSTRKSQTSTCPILEALCPVILFSSLRCPRRAKRPHSRSTITILSPRPPSRSSPRGRRHRWRTACRCKNRTQAIWTPSFARLSHLPAAIPSGTRSFPTVNHLRRTTSIRSESHSYMPVNRHLRVMGSWNLIFEHQRPHPRATASLTPAVATWEIHFEAPQISVHSSLHGARSRLLAAVDRVLRAGGCVPTSGHSLW